MIKLACILPDNPNGSLLYRYSYPSKWLSENNNIEIVEIKAMPETRLIRTESLYECNMAIFYRFIPENWQEIADNLKKRHIPFLVDLDDWEPDIPRTWLHEMFHVIPKNAWLELQKFLSIATAGTCTTLQIQHRMIKHNPKIFIIPNALPMNQIPKRPRLSSKYVIGFAGFPVHLFDMRIFWEAIDRIYDKIKSAVEIKVIGIEGERSYASLSVPIVPPHVYHKTLAGLDLDLGVAPLEDNALNWGKSNVKFLEYTATGSITLCTALGDYLNLPDWCCLKVPRENPIDVWANQILYAIQNGKEWAFKKWLDAYHYALANYDISIVGPKWGKLLLAIHEDYAY